MVSRDVLLVGLGNIGTRYLQGLCSVGEVSVIHVIEPSEESFSHAMQAVGFTTQPTTEIQRVTYSQVLSHYFLIIIATSAGPRSQVVSSLSNVVEADFWVLEKVLGQSVSELEAMKQALRQQVVMVNTPRRMSHFYTNMKEALCGATNFDFSVLDPMFAIGCNAIHFIDLLEWLTDSEVIKISIDAQSPWFRAKRPGYCEFMGLLTAVFESGARLKISNIANVESVALTSDNGSVTINIDESAGFELGETSAFTSRLEYQSELTPRLFKQLLHDPNHLPLPTLQASCRQHEVFFDGLNRSNLGKTGDHKWPIT